MCSFAVFLFGVVLWAVGAFYDKSQPADKKGWAELPGCLITLVGIVLIAISFKWWIGLGVLGLLVYGAYRLIKV